MNERLSALSDRARFFAQLPGELFRGAWGLRGCDEVGSLPRSRYSAPVVHNDGTMVLGDRVSFNGLTVPVLLATDEDGEIHIGDRTFINFGTAVKSCERVSIGASVRVGPFSLIDDHPIPGDPDGPSGPISIGDRCWLASRVTVLPGVSIGDRSVITAGTVVTEDVPPGVIAGGDPIRIFRELRDD